MNWTFKPRLHIIMVIMILFGLVFGINQRALAQGIDFDSQVTAGETVQNDILLTGNTITLDGTVVGDVLAVGSTVQINGTVEGSLILIGRFVTVDGQVNGTTYGIGRELALNESANLDRNLYFLGLTLDMLEGSRIGRDLVALTLGADLKGEIGRDVRAIIGAVPIIKLITELVGSEISGLPIRSSDVLANETSPGAQVQYAGILPLTQYLAGIDLQSGSIDTQRLGEWALDRLRELVTLFVFGILGIWLLSRQLNRRVTGLCDRHQYNRRCDPCRRSDYIDWLWLRVINFIGFGLGGVGGRPRLPGSGFLDLLVVCYLWDESYRSLCGRAPFAGPTCAQRHPL